METDAPLETADAPALPAGLRSRGLGALWAEACEWVVWIAAVFAPATLRTTGVSRHQGARLSLWLRNVEGAVRRLILSAALVLTPPALTPAAARLARPRSQPSASATRRHAFCLFRRRSGSTAPTPLIPTAAPPRAARPYGHIPFPIDPLLALGPAPKRVNRAATLRARNPLDRWVRLSRLDPDWRAPEEKPFHDPSDEDRFAWLLEDTTLDHRPPPKPRPPRKPYDPLPDSLFDWRRCHDEWEKVIPAPALAARIEALDRVAANPAAIIARAARRLARHGNRGPLHIRQAAPTNCLPRRLRNRIADAVSEHLNDRCHDALVSPDTS